VSEAEAAIMGQDVTYWQEQVERARAIVFGPVAEPAGVWGLAVVDADSEADVRALGLADPAVTSQLARFETYAMPGAIDGRTTQSGPRYRPSPAVPRHLSKPR
jgi:uncharacterized protein